ncbi:MAG: holo-ACP synthase [Casimicrobiaceae bacterium]
MIHGIGTDIVAIERIQAALARHGERLLERVLSASERRDFDRLQPEVAAAWLAKRWAAKEAFGKALGTGVTAPFTLAAISTAHSASGRPCFDLAPALSDVLRAHGVGRVSLSLADEQAYAIAFVVMECADDADA